MWPREGDCGLAGAAAAGQQLVHRGLSCIMIPVCLLLECSDYLRCFSTTYTRNVKQQLAKQLRHARGWLCPLQQGLVQKLCSALAPLLHVKVNLIVHRQAPRFFQHCYMGGEQPRAILFLDSPMGHLLRRMTRGVDIISGPGSMTPKVRVPFATGRSKSHLYQAGQRQACGRNNRVISDIASSPLFTWFDLTAWCQDVPMRGD
jgi:hypothetical protein